MKYAVNTARIVVGLLFIFSGLVKANDPLGLSYKMEEFFEIWGMTKFNDWTLLMSVLMNAFEIIAGFAILIGWRVKLFTWLLLLLILFFTFLTGYTYITGMPKNCGCFGDCLPISSKTSFFKDVILTVLIGLLFWKQKLIKPILSLKLATITLFVVTVLAFGFQWYTLNYLPVVDCLPFKKGNNISEQLKLPANAIPDKIEITFSYIKDGNVLKFPADSIPAGFNAKDYTEGLDESEDLPDGSLRALKVYVKGGTPVEFSATGFPADFNEEKYTLIKRYDKLIQKGSNNEPPIKGFVLKGVTDVDSTEIVLAQPYALLLISTDFNVPVSKWKNSFGKVYATAKAKNIPVYMISGKPSKAPQMVKETNFSDIQIFKSDYTTIRTAARVDPTIYFLKKGTIDGKWSYRNMSQVLDAIKKITSGTQP